MENDTLYFTDGDKFLTPQEEAIVLQLILNGQFKSMSEMQNKIVIGFRTKALMKLEEKCHQHYLKNRR